ncbi:MAG: hypothetical protein SFY66_21630 [Oculatellaceae cyanobacterium bins.114]|nr:hypothetical protein [Oculatellaceae cyanobacterium bins.114]
MSLGRMMKVLQPLIFLAGAGVSDRSLRLDGSIELRRTSGDFNRQASKIGQAISDVSI